MKSYTFHPKSYHIPTPKSHPIAGSGKTHTMTGRDGVLPKALRQMWSHVAADL